MINDSYRYNVASSLDPLCGHLVNAPLGPEPGRLGAPEKVTIEKSHIHVVDGPQLERD